ncbi:MAG: translation initiation factor IF-2 [Acidobacteria bacterium]|nr:translation initiation factor IF-2 [Acidobacteriota bacterium]
MGKIKVHEIAKRFGLDNKDVLLKLKSAGIQAATPLSAVDDTCLELFKKDAALRTSVHVKPSARSAAGTPKPPRASKPKSAAKPVTPAAEEKPQEKEKKGPRKGPRPAPALTQPEAAPPAVHADAAAAPPGGQAAPTAAAQPAAVATATGVQVPAARAAATAPATMTPATPSVSPKTVPAAPVTLPSSLAAATGAPAAPAKPPYMQPTAAPAPSRDGASKGPAPQSAAAPRPSPAPLPKIEPPRPPMKGAGGSRPGYYPQSRYSRPGGASGRSSASPRPAPAPKPLPPPPPAIPLILRPLTVSEGTMVRDLAEKMEVKAGDVLKRLMARGVMATINMSLSPETASEVAKEFGFELKTVSFEDHASLEELQLEKGGVQTPRSPVVTIMGHVDHGKTTLLDAIRETNVVATEHGGITQHIGAYTVHVKNRGITFLDTPGHEAFTLMRARGAQVTDIVVLVVAADDGVMPQTVEAINHARAAGVPIIVAINKMDKPDAKPDRVRKELSEHSLLVEDWGGDTVSVPISAKQKTGLSDLLDMILLVADLKDYKGDATIPAAGTVLESRLDRSRGPVATVLVQQGTLRVGDPFIAGTVNGKVRALFDDLGRRLLAAGPSTPATVLGLEGVPSPGDRFKVITEEWKARQIGAYRQQKQREDQLQKSSRLTLDHLYQKIQEGVVKELNLVVKADVQGSLEAISNTLERLSNPKVKLRFIHTAAGAISESDVLLASSSNAIVVGFNVRPDPGARALADTEGVDLRLHTVIYEIADEIKRAMEGMLEPTFQEVQLGRAEVRNTFKVPKVGIIAGSFVLDGRIVRNADARILRDNVVVYQGKISSLRRFKEDVGEVKSGYECGMAISNFSDVKVGDIIEAYKVEKVAPKELVT